MEVQFRMFVLIFIFVVFWTLCDGRTAVKIFCDPKDHQYYRADLKKCRTCEPCHIGEGIESFEEVNMGPNGATTCPFCFTCLPGTFSASREYECQNCKKCPTHEREIVGCTPKENSVCGDFSLITTPLLTTKTTTTKRSLEGKSSLKKMLHELVLHYLWIPITLLVIVCILLARCILLCYSQRRHLQRIDDDGSLAVSLPTNCLNGSTMLMQHDSNMDNADCYLLDFEKDTYKEDKQSMQGATQNSTGSTTYLTSFPGENDKGYTDEKQGATQNINGNTTTLASLPQENNTAYKKEKLSTQGATQNINGSTTSLASFSQESILALTKVIAGGIGPEEFAVRLGINEQDISIIMKENHGDLMESSYKMIQKVCQSKPHLKTTVFQQFKS